MKGALMAMGILTADIRLVYFRKTTVVIYRPSFYIILFRRLSLETAQRGFREKLVANNLELRYLMCKRIQPGFAHC